MATTLGISKDFARIEAWDVTPPVDRTMPRKRSPSSILRSAGERSSATSTASSGISNCRSDTPARFSDIDLFNASFHRPAKAFDFTRWISGLLLVYRAQIHPRLQHIGASSTESRCRGQSVQSSAPALMGPRRLLPSPAFIRAELAHRLDHALLIFLPFFFLGP